MSMMPARRALGGAGDPLTNLLVNHDLFGLDPSLRGWAKTLSDRSCACVWRLSPDRESCLHGNRPEMAKGKGLDSGAIFTGAWQWKHLPAHDARE